MLTLPLIAASLAALVLAKAALAMLATSPLAQANYRGAKVASPLGLVIALAALAALVPLVLAQRIAQRQLLEPELWWITAFVLGVTLLGLADDALGGQARGLRGHLSALRHGRLDSGVLKALGTLGLALAAMTWRAGSTGRFALGAAVLVLATHVFNLVDLRPGRAIKSLVLLGVALTIGSGELAPLWALGLFVGPAIVLGWFDLRERGMLGDAGSGLLGALAGIWLVLTLSVTGLAMALAALVAISAFGEFRSISALVERAPLLRHLDSLGRLHDALDA